MYNDIVQEIDEKGEKLSDWEKQFIASLIDNPPEWYSKKQEETVKRIYDQRVPR